MALSEFVHITTRCLFCSWMAGWSREYMEMLHSLVPPAGEKESLHSSTCRSEVCVERADHGQLYPHKYLVYRVQGVTDV